jgi:hypothetical protein
MMAVMIYLFTNLPSNLKAIAALETAKRLSLRLKTQTMAVLRLLMSLLLVGTQFRASDPVVDMVVVVVVGMEAEAAAAEDEVVEATEVAAGMGVVAAGMGVEVMAAVGEEVVVEDTEGVVVAVVGMAEVAVEVVIVAGSRGIWPGTVHKVAVAVEVVEGMVVEAAVEEVEEGVTTVAVLAILPGSVLIVDVDFRVWSGNSKKET